MTALTQINIKEGDEPPEEKDCKKLATEWL